MEFELHENAQLIADSARKVLRETYTSAHRRAILDGGPTHFDRHFWQQLGNLGWLGICVPEEYGGSGQPLESMMTLVEAFGEHLVSEPYVDSALLCSQLLVLLGTAAQKQEWLPAAVAGEARIALAHRERGMRYRYAAVETVAHPHPDGYVLDGSKTAIPFGSSADRLIVTARLTREASDTPVIGAFLVDPASAGLTVRPYMDFEGLPAADIECRGVVVPARNHLPGSGDAWPVLDSVLARALAATCIEAIGTLTMLHAMTLDYAKLRTQFGVPIAQFQVIQHRLVDMLTKIELARPLARLAVSVAGALQPDPILLSAAKVQISDSCRFVGEQAIQLHGGIGMTDELDASHYFKRLVALEKRLGDRHYHLGVIAEAIAQGKPSVYE